MYINTQGHSFHLVDPSPWPIITSVAAFAATSGGVMYFHNYSGGGFVLTLGLFMIILMMIVWWRDIIKKQLFEGQHTAMVEKVYVWVWLYLYLQK